MRFFYTVWVDTDTKDHADEVMTNRIDVDEWYGFDYTIDSVAHTEWHGEGASG